MKNSRSWSSRRSCWDLVSACSREQQTRLAAPASAGIRRSPRSASRPGFGHTRASITEAQTALVKQYCAACHNDRDKNNAGGLSLASFDASKVGHDAQVADVAEKMIRKLRAGHDAAAGAGVPTRATLDAFAGLARSEARSGGRARPEPRPPDVPAAESRRVRALDRGHCSRSTSTSRRSCRPTPSATTSTTSPTCSRSRRRCSKATCARPAASAALAVGDPKASARTRPTRFRARRRSSRTSRARRSARAAASRSCTTSRPTASTPSG